MGKLRVRDRKSLVVELRSEHFKDRVLLKHPVLQATFNHHHEYYVSDTCYVPRALHELTLIQTNLWV